MVAAAKVSTLAEALVSAQAEFPAVEPNAVNPHFKSRFVTLDHLIAKTRPILNKHGLAITQEPTYTALSIGSDANIGPALKTTLLHVSGESRESVMPLMLSKNDMQGLGAALTYAKRYAWSAALGISADEDDDGNAASPKDADVPEPLRSDERAQERRELQQAVQRGIDRLGAVDANWTLPATLAAASKSFGKQITALADLNENQLSQILTALSLAEEQLEIEEAQLEEERDAVKAAR